MEGIEIENTKINTLLFADDVVLIADCPIKLQYLLDALGKWCKDNQMMINHDKTKIIHFRHPKKKLCQSTFSCSETPIQYTCNTLRQQMNQQQIQQQYSTVY